LKFLNYHGGHPEELYRSIGANPGPKEFCPILHPNLTCTQFTTTYFVKEFSRAAMLYIPVYFLVFVVSRRKKFMGLLYNILISSTFLTTYCTLGMISGCMMYRFFLPVAHWKMYFHCWIAGLATLIERPGRRADLAVYCSTYAFDSLHRALLDMKLISKMPSLNSLLLAIFAAYLLHHHERHPEMVMKWVFKISSS